MWKRIAAKYVSIKTISFLEGYFRGVKNPKLETIRVEDVLCYPGATPDIFIEIKDMIIKLKSK